ncbi:hypothetical protein [Spiroplasma turonicum]|uniref:Uncharacterized protein n=1 Tax=Spiroplasma turonicum TaxID=216946 RepID=A0A0K1P4Z8_9MOLU|nr:hypothetical protein [Spiroplasma turonicum]AKU79386.1 hypothetical protein STURON_00140 [Spiroplasma turonicum]ALX70407.1 hypothetical protein STURO_v1c01380 [Spiroplasma turonicum]
MSKYKWGDNIFTTNINNQQLRENDPNKDKHIKISSDVKNALSFDIVFFNHVFKNDNEEYYKLFLRPAPNDDNNLEIELNSNKTITTIFNIHGKFFINTKDGFKSLKNEESKDIFIFDSIDGGYDLLKPIFIYFRGHQFKELHIPLSLLEGVSQISLTYQLQYQATKFFKPENSGKIQIDLVNSIDYVENNNNIQKIKLYNKASTYIQQIPYIVDGANSYNEIINELYEIEMEDKNNKFIDKNYHLNTYFESKVTDSIKELLYPGMEQTINTFINKTNYDLNFKTQSEIVASSEFPKYYDIKNYKDKIKIENNKYFFSLDNKTNFSYPSNKVTECDSLDCSNGILYSPLYSGPLIFSKTININGIILTLDFKVSNNDLYKLNLISSDTKNLFSENYVVKIDLEKISKMFNKDKEGVISYINENQTKI